MDARAPSSFSHTHILVSDVIHQVGCARVYALKRGPLTVFMALCIVASVVSRSSLRPSKELHRGAALQPQNQSSYIGRAAVERQNTRFMFLGSKGCEEDFGLLFSHAIYRWVSLDDRWIKLGHFFTFFFLHPTSE